jgi:hypothetical protein
MNLLSILFIFVFQLPLAQSANVLFFLLGTNAFDRHIFEFIAQQIALRHHNVVTIKPILIPEEPRLVKPRLHMVREKMIKNVVPRFVFLAIFGNLKGLVKSFGCCEDGWVVKVCLDKLLGFFGKLEFCDRKN